MRPGKWKNKEKVITGYWSYNWSSDDFYVVLNSRDKITGLQRAFFCYGNKPEWGNWKLIKEKQNDR